MKKVFQKKLRRGGKKKGKNKKDKGLSASRLPNSPRSSHLRKRRDRREWRQVLLAQARRRGEGTHVAGGEREEIREREREREREEGKKASSPSACGACCESKLSSATMTIEAAAAAAAPTAAAPAAAAPPPRDASAPLTDAEAALYDRQLRVWGVEAQKR